MNQGGFPARMAAENLHLEYKGSGLMPKKRVAGSTRVSVGKRAVSAHVQRGSLLLPVGDKPSCARTEASAGSSMQRSSPEVLQGRPGPRWAGNSDALGFDLSDAPAPTQPTLSPAETSLLHAALWAPLETLQCSQPRLGHLVHAGIVSLDRGLQRDRGQGTGPEPCPTRAAPAGRCGCRRPRTRGPAVLGGEGGGERPASGGRDHGAGFLQWERGAGREAALIGRRGCQSLGQAGSRLSAAPRRGRPWRWTWGCGAGR